MSRVLALAASCSCLVLACSPAGGPSADTFDPASAFASAASGHPDGRTLDDLAKLEAVMSPEQLEYLQNASYANQTWQTLLADPDFRMAVEVLYSAHAPDEHASLWHELGSLVEADARAAGIGWAGTGSCSISYMNSVTTPWMNEPWQSTTSTATTGGPSALPPTAVATLADALADGIAKGGPDPVPAAGAPFDPTARQCSSEFFASAPLDSACAPMDFCTSPQPDTSLGYTCPTDGDTGGPGESGFGCGTTLPASYSGGLAGRSCLSFDDPSMPGSTLAPASKIEVVAQNGDGTWTTYPGTQSQTGGFTVPGAPAGERWLHVDDLWVLTSQTVVDLTVDMPGRFFQFPINNATPMSLDVTGLAPWTAADTLYLCSFPADFLDLALESSAPPAPGDTSAHLQDDASLATNAHEVDVGDPLTLVHLAATSTPGGLNPVAATEALTTTAVSLTDGQPATISGAVAPLAQTSVALNLSGSAFAAVASAVNPNATPQDLDVSIVATSTMYAEDIGFDFLSDAATLLSLDEPPGTDATDTVSFGNPFDGVTAVADVEAQYSVPIADSSGTSQVEFVKTRVLESVADLQADVVAPLVGPFSGFTVDGHDGFEGGAISATPTLAWDAPAGGDDDFRIDVEQHFPTGSWINVATLVGHGHTLTVPPGIVASGASLHFDVQRLRSPVDHTATPFAVALDEGDATLVSGVFTAP